MTDPADEQTTMCGPELVKNACAHLKSEHAHNWAQINQIQERMRTLCPLLGTEIQKRMRTLAQYGFAWS